MFKRWFKIQIGNLTIKWKFGRFQVGRVPTHGKYSISTVSLGIVLIKWWYPLSA